MRARLESLFTDTCRIDDHLRAFVSCERWISENERHEVTVIRYRIDNVNPVIGVEPITVYEDAELVPNDSNTADAIRYTIREFDALVERWMSDPVNIGPYTPPSA